MATPHVRHDLHISGTLPWVDVCHLVFETTSAPYPGVTVLHLTPIRNPVGELHLPLSPITMCLHLETD